MLNSFRRNFANLIDPTRAQVRARRSEILTVRETDDTITKGSRGWDNLFRDREDTKRDQLLTDVITAWRSNPIAKRIIEITTEFVVGDGFSFDSTQPRVKKFLSELWNHEINDLDAQIGEWADEAWRGGDLYLLATIDSVGMTYWRAVPTELIENIVCKNNDYRQEEQYEKGLLEENPYISYQAWKAAGGSGDSFMLHFPLNRAVGNIFGESDLVSVLYWIKLYRQWLEDRARLNFFRQMFTFILKKAFNGSETEKTKYVLDFIAKLPKKAGGILALDTDETLGTLNPNLASFEAGEDGLAIKRMITTGVGMPMHYFSEPESSTRTTADAAGTPTFRRFRNRQKFLANAVRRMLTVACEVRRHYDSRMPAKPDISINTPDITERDNANLALAVQRIVQAISPLYNAGKISANEVLRLVYRFLAETRPESEPEPDADKPIPLGAGGGGGALPSEKDNAQ